MSDDRYSCYCLPGEARCDDPYARCDRANREAAPRKVIVLHMVYPDGTHTGDCEGCLWSQDATARTQESA